MLLSGCGRRKPPVVVGSKNDTEGALLGEIVAQHLERRLEGNVQRQLALGGTAIVYQALVTGQIGLYPEYTGLIETEVMKETPSKDPAVMLVRVRAEMVRLAQAELIDPLGFDARPAMIVQASDAPKEETLSAASEGAMKWKIGVPFDFQNRPDGIPALNVYKLPSSAAVRGMDPKDTFRAMEQGEINMVAGTATDAHLASTKWRALKDDRSVFSPQLACLLVRLDKLAEEPRLKPALQELSGKFTVETMRKLNARVEIAKEPVAQVAAAALAAAGLK